MALPTTRRSGLGGVAELGDAGAAYDGIDCQDVSLTVNQTTLDANAKSDVYEVKQLHRRSASGSIKKMISTSAFCKTALLGTTMALTLTSGDSVGGAAGEEMFSGTVIITKVGWQSPDGMEAEDVDWVSTGTFALADAA